MAQDVGNALGQDKFVCPATFAVHRYEIPDFLRNHTSLFTRNSRGFDIVYLVKYTLTQNRIYFI